MCCCKEVEVVNSDFLTKFDGIAVIIVIGRIRPKWSFDPKTAAPFHASSTGGKTRKTHKLLSELKLHSEIMHENQSVCLVRPS